MTIFYEFYYTRLDGRGAHSGALDADNLKEALSLFEQIVPLENVDEVTFSRIEVLPRGSSTSR